jgi:hypothetical protein
LSKSDDMAFLLIQVLILHTARIQLAYDLHNPPIKSEDYASHMQAVSWFNPGFVICVYMQFSTRYLQFKPGICSSGTFFPYRPGIFLIIVQQIV